jgi:pentatricopeptide repeat protein
VETTACYFLLMSWVAFDRALRIARHCGLPAPVQTWTQTSTTIYEEIIEKGWNAKKKSFIQYYGSDAVDASALLMVITKFAGGTDPLIVQTIDCIQRELSTDSLVRRYDSKHAADDGLGNLEGTFSPCSFWMAEALAQAGRLDDACLMLKKMLTYGHHVGLYAEEIGPIGETLGNYPQAFTHLSLITACYNIDQALNNRK